MAKSGDTQSEMIFTTNQMAELLGLTPRRFQQLAEEGVIVKSGQIQHPIPAICNHWSGTNVGHADSSRGRINASLSCPI